MSRKDLSQMRHKGSGFALSSLKETKIFSLNISGNVLRIPVEETWSRGKEVHNEREHNLLP